MKKKLPEWIKEFEELYNIEVLNYNGFKYMPNYKEKEYTRNEFKIGLIDCTISGDRDDILNMLEKE